MNSSTTLVARRDHFDYEMLMVVAGFLAGYTANTLMAYQHDLRVFVSWCRDRELLLMLGRHHPHGEVVCWCGLFDDWRATSA